MGLVPLVFPNPVAEPDGLIGSLAPGRAQEHAACLPATSPGCKTFRSSQGFVSSLSPGKTPSRGCEECGPKELLVPWPGPQLLSMLRQERSLGAVTAC